MLRTFGHNQAQVKYRCCSNVFHLVTFCILFLLFGVCTGKSCTQDGLCKCKFDDGSGTVDLSPIGRNDGTPLEDSGYPETSGKSHCAPELEQIVKWCTDIEHNLGTFYSLNRVTAFIKMQDQFAPDNYAYSFNPCYPFTEGTCVNAAACQYDSNNNVYYNIGDSSKVTLSYDGLNVIGEYMSDDGARSSKVTFQCDPNVDPPTDTANGETSTTVYEFTIVSKYACPQGGGNPGTTSSPPSGGGGGSDGISPGTILIIIFFSVLVVYLIAGVAFNKYHRQNTGKEIVPNVSLWTSLPGLIKDGVMFCVSKIRRKGGYGKI